MKSLFVRRGILTETCFLDPFSSSAEAVGISILCIRARTQASDLELWQNIPSGCHINALHAG